MESLRLIGPRGPGTGISGVPVVKPTAICLLPSGSEESQRGARELDQSIRDFLLGLHQNVNAAPLACGHGVAGVAGCPACSAAGGLSLLVLVGGAEKFGPIPDLDWWLNASGERKVLPVYPAGEHPEKRLPGELTKFNAAFWGHSPAETTSTVLSAAGITSESHRIFISYRRLETEPLAEDLFEALNREGFDVFLDRFSVPAAAVFQRRLHHELAEKSMVLLLESDRFGESKWTTEEVAYCKQHRLGLFALQMPHGMDPNVPTRKLPDVDDDVRRTLNLLEFEPGKFPMAAAGGGTPQFMQWGPLNEAARPAIVREIKERHDRALLRRRGTLRSEMVAALKMAGAAEEGYRADGMLSVKSKSGEKRYVVWITTRPPELPDFQVTDGGCRNPVPSIGVVVGHKQLLEPEAQRRLAWLAGVCELVFVDEGQIVAAAEAIARGTLELVQD